jgi:hypothetical protein
MFKMFTLGNPAAETCITAFCVRVRVCRRSIRDTRYSYRLSHEENKKLLFEKQQLLHTNVRGMSL